MTPAYHYVADAVPDHATLFDALLRETAWDTRMRARATASFGRPYDYAQLRYPATELPPRIAALIARVASLAPLRPNNCLLNLYADGHGSMGWHNDHSTALAPGTGVAIVSLGAPRTLHFRGARDRTARHAQVLAPGSLLYLSAAVDAEWQHALPPEPAAGARISATLRQLAG